ncbi:uncharacterized protein C6orf226 homolog [Oryzias latipes]|uniref:uncharacterized protein C6orf226 homolog n=1 Tax=Oryzias latipes TaxID=8090 RepID=UPI0000E9C843|nr:uncharacterized protein C6orf226 homolog [Oryzias latipes]
MELVFSRFESYNFESDPRFMDGLKTLKKTTDKSGEENQLLDLKLFFYNRFVEPIERSSYKQWSSAPHPPSTFTPEHKDQISLQSEDQSRGTCTNSQSRQLSFAEVMQLVQEGKEVPGVTKLDVHASNQSPTPSQMERRQKPWETSPP